MLLCRTMNLLVLPIDPTATSALETGLCGVVLEHVFPLGVVFTLAVAGVLRAAAGTALLPHHGKEARTTRRIQPLLKRVYKPMTLAAGREAMAYNSATVHPMLALVNFLEAARITQNKLHCLLYPFTGLAVGALEAFGAAAADLAGNETFGATAVCLHVPATNFGHLATHESIVRALVPSEDVFAVAVSLMPPFLAQALAAATDKEYLSLNIVLVLDALADDETRSDSAIDTMAPSLNIGLAVFFFVIPLPLYHDVHNYSPPLLAEPFADQPLAAAPASTVTPPDAPHTAAVLLHEEVLYL